MADNEHVSQGARMNRRTLERWLHRVLPNTIAIELVHAGAEDKDRIVMSYESAQCRDADGLRDVVAELITTAQDETDILDARASFTVRVTHETPEGIRVKASTRIRCEPTRDRADGEAPPDEPSREGLIALLMEQNRTLHRIVADAPSKHRTIYMELIDLLKDQVRDRDTELAKAYELLGAAGHVDAETLAKQAAEEERRSEALRKFGGDALELVKAIAANHFGYGADGAETGTVQ
jgi:hypothetical protein